MLKKNRGREAPFFSGKRKKVCQDTQKYSRNHPTKGDRLGTINTDDFRKEKRQKGKNKVQGGGGVR